MATLKDRFEKLEKLFAIRPTLLDDKSINCELLIDLLIAVYTDIQRYALLTFQFLFLRVAAHICINQYLHANHNIIFFSHFPPEEMHETIEIKTHLPINLLNL